MHPGGPNSDARSLTGRYGAVRVPESHLGVVRAIESPAPFRDTSPLPLRCPEPSFCDAGAVAPRPDQSQQRQNGWPTGSRYTRQLSSSAYARLHLVAVAPRARTRCSASLDVVDGDVDVELLALPAPSARPGAS